MIINCDSVRYIWEVLEGQEYSYLFDKLRVLDLGCNIGAFSLWIYPHAEKIWAVDCETSHLDHFRQTIKDNSLQNITLLEERVRDLAPFMSGHGIERVDLLKIDIEGDEYEVFKKPDFPYKQIQTIIGEYHKESLERIMYELGYEYYEMPNKHFLARKR